MSTKNYIVTAQKATAVSCSLTGHFTGEFDRNLLIAKHNTLELHLVCPEGLTALKEITIYGKISVMLGFRPEGRSAGTDLIFILTQKKDAMILECQTDTSAVGAGEVIGGGGQRLRVVTLASGNLHERIGRLSENGPLGIADPRGRVVALRLYEGLLKVIPVSFAKKPYDPDAGPDVLKAFNVRIEEIDVVDMAFIDSAQPTIAYIIQDPVGRHLKTMEISLEAKDLCPGPWKMDSIETQAAMLIPLPMPHPGVIIVGQEVITLRSKEGSLKTIAPPVIRTSPMVAFERLDCNRFLLGDMAGRLFMLFVERDGDRVKDMKVELLGETSIPESISYLDNGVVYIGSRFGDSQLIRLSVDADAAGNFLHVLESFVNLAPVVDMAVVDVDNLGQGQLVTCSGAFKDGSLRVIRSGVGINELANIDLEGVKGVWALRARGSAFDNLLVVTFIGHTKTLLLANPPGDAELEIEEVALPGFEAGQQTYLCQGVHSGQTVQVTPSSARLLDAGHLLLAEWRPPVAGRTISVCAADSRRLLLASGRSLACLEIGAGSLTLRAERELPHEIACLDVAAAHHADGALGGVVRVSDCGDYDGGIAAVGLWTDFSVRLLRLPDLQEACVELLGVQIIPRSVLLATLPCGSYLFVGLGDGSLVYYSLTVVPGGGACSAQLADPKRVSIGTQPMILRRLAPHSVFACSDRPAIAHSSAGKLVFSHVNVREVAHMCPLAAEPQCVALATASQLVFGAIDDIQKLHIRSVPLGEAPRKVAHQPETGTLAVVTSRIDLRHEGSYAPARASVSVTAPHQATLESGGGIGGGVVGKQPLTAAAPAAAAAPAEADEELEVTSLVLFDQHSFEPLCALHFPANPSCVETATSVVSAQLGPEGATYYVVGTAFVRPNESEPSAGRLIVLQYNAEGSGLTKVAEKDIRGAPYALCGFNQRLMACVNSSVRLFEWSESEKELRPESSHFNNILALYLKTKGDFALVGDLMRSMSLLLYKPVETSLEEIARDHAPNWMFAVEIIDDDSFLGSETWGNLFVCSREAESSAGEERLRLQETALYHLDDTVNVFHHGSLVMNQLGEKLVPVSTPILYGTVSGAIGLLCQLPAPLFDFLDELQRRLAGVIVGVGGVEHAKYRAFENEHRVEPAKDFVDGDLIEAVLDLGRDKLVCLVRDLHRKTDFSSSVSESVPCTAEDLTKIVEELSRLH